LWGVKEIMVRKETIKGKAYYQCEICKFYYEEKEWADKCEEFCKEHNACSVEITKHSVKPKKEKEDCCK
jgi:hypothetical protein